MDHMEHTDKISSWYLFLENVDVDFLINKLGACGRFQVILVTLLALAEMPAAISMMLMSFGNYNPGWRCMDNKSLANDTSWEVKDCASFQACQNVQFNPESSTVVTEWGLVCDKKWVSSVIIYVQMVGILVGSYVTGYFGDKFGRKLTFCFGVLMNSLFNLLGYFSVSWQMFAATRFLCGLMHHCNAVFPFIMSSQFSSSKWRGLIAGIPTFGIGAVLFAICAMITKDWRQVQLFAAVIIGILFIPSLWASESIRWLALKGKREKVFSVTKKIARYNQKALSHGKDLDDLWDTAEGKDDSEKSRQYSWLHLWRGKALKRTIIFTPLWVNISLPYFVIGFGVKALSGNFYLNLMISQISEIPASFLTTFASNLLGRRKGVLFNSLFIMISMFVIVFLDRQASPDVRGLGILILVMLIKVAASTEWYILQVFTVELYPTVIRSTCLGYGYAITRVGGILAPYLIPSDPDSYFISYSIMGFLNLVCSVLMLLLPETKGVQLIDTWNITEETQDEKREQDNNVL